MAVPSKSAFEIEGCCYCRRFKDKFANNLEQSILWSIIANVHTIDAA